jgi:glutamate N-acetyltransferase/amino-acid N-acetyltransferase
MSPALKDSDIPRGFCFAATACGLKKKGGLDLALLASDRPASAAAIFTTNLVQAAPVVASRSHLRTSRSRMRAILVNSGNANCCTGAEGMAAAATTATVLATKMGIHPSQVLVCSTGVIGVPMPWRKITGAVPELVRHRSNAPKAFAQVTRAIMTTDTRPKWASGLCCIAGKTVRLLGCAKGAGMIHPNMATMLAFVLTDAAVSPPLLRRALHEITAKTFNSITVDGDTSTNDTLAVLANGASGAPRISRYASLAPRHSRDPGDYGRFVSALEQVCRTLALAIVADGEGARRVVEVDVRGARNSRDADRIARAIAHSPLVKTALAGADPNWGRILAAAGRAGVKFDPDRVRIRLAGIPVFRDGRPLPFDERAAHRALLAKHVAIVVDLRERAARRNSKFKTRKSGIDRGPLVAGHAVIYTCDFTSDYVKINASYRT